MPPKHLIILPFTLSSIINLERIFMYAVNQGCPINFSLKVSFLTPSDLLHKTAFGLDISLRLPLDYSLAPAAIACKWPLVHEFIQVSGASCPAKAQGPCAPLLQKLISLWIDQESPWEDLFSLWLLRTHSNFSYIKVIQ